MMATFSVDIKKEIEKDKIIHAKPLLKSLVIINITSFSLNYNLTRFNQITNRFNAYHSILEKTKAFRMILSWHLVFVDTIWTFLRLKMNCSAWLTVTTIFSLAFYFTILVSSKHRVECFSAVVVVLLIRSKALNTRNSASSSIYAATRISVCLAYGRGMATTWNHG